MESAICGEDIWITKDAKTRERHETSHLVNGIEVEDSVERGVWCVFRVACSVGLRFTQHVSWSGRVLGSRPSAKRDP